MPDPLPSLIAGYVKSLVRENASAHTVRNYSADLEGWLGYLTPPNGEAPPIAEIDVLAIREWLGSLYESGLQPLSIRRKLSAVRSFLRWAERQGLVNKNVARLVRTPKAPQTLPHVPAPETTVGLIEQIPVKAAATERPHPARDLAIIELLYGCGLRISELTGLSVGDVDFADHWLRVQGRGERNVRSPSARRLLRR